MVNSSSANQQLNGVNFKETDLYAPTLKAAEGRLLMTIAAAKQQQMGTRSTRQIPIKRSCTVTWEMTWYTFDHQIGGRNQFRKVTSCFQSKASTAPSKQLVSDMTTYQNG